MVGAALVVHVQVHGEGVLTGLEGGLDTDRTGWGLSAERGVDVGHVDAHGALVQGARRHGGTIKGDGVRDIPAVGLVWIAASVLNISVEERTTHVQVACFTFLREGACCTRAVGVVALVNAHA